VGGVLLAAGCACTKCCEGAGRCGPWEVPRPSRLPLPRCSLACPEPVKPSSTPTVPSRARAAIPARALHALPTPITAPAHSPPQVVRHDVTEAVLACALHALPAPITAPAHSPPQVVRHDVTEAVLAHQLEESVGEDLQEIVSGTSFSTVPPERVEAIKGG